MRSRLLTLLIILFVFALAIWCVMAAVTAHAQTMSVDRKSTMSAVRDLINEPSTVYLPDSSLVRMVNYAAMMTAVAMREKTTMVIDTIITSPARTTYRLSPSTVDSAMSGVAVLVIQKDATAIGGKEHALNYVPYDMVGNLMTDGAPAFYTMAERHIILGASPYGGDTLLVFLPRIGRNLDADTTAVRVAKEDHVAVVYLASALAEFADNQIQMGQMYWNLWQAHVGLKGYPPPKEQAPAQ